MQEQPFGHSTAAYIIEDTIIFDLEADGGPQHQLDSCGGSLCGQKGVFMALNSIHMRQCVN
jgi:hypothetical protein